MKIVMLIHSFHPHIGGAERQLLSQLPYYKKHDLELIIVTRKEPNSKPHESIKGAQVFRTKTFSMKWLSALNYIYQSLFIILRHQPEIIHTYDLISTSFTASIANIIFNIPYCVKILSSGTGGDINRILRKRFGKFRFNLLKKTCARYFAMSDQIVLELKQQNIEESRIIKIYNGIDFNHFIPASEEIKNKFLHQLQINPSFIAIYTGRFVSLKNLNDIITSWINIADDDAILLLIGDGPEKNNLQMISDNTVRFIPKCDDVLPYLQIADCFILASDYEGFSNSLIEAMSTSVVPIVSNVVGNKELVKHNKTGMLFPLHDTQELTNKIQDLKNNPKKLETLKKKAREFIIENFDLEKLILIIWKTYKEVINE